MKSMKSIMSAGFCLVAMLVVSMVAAGAASAAPVWEHCETEKINTTVSKWTTGQCTTASSMAAAGFSWQVVEGTEKVVSHATVTLEDTKVPILGTVTVICTGNDEGTVGPRSFDRIERITEIKCVKGENCGTLVGNAEPLHLPWQTELYETEKQVRDAIQNSGAGIPGWKVTCETAGIKAEDTCTNANGFVVVSNQTTKGVKGELLVLGDFPKPNVPKAECSVGGKESGDVLGTVALLQANGNGLRVS